MPYTGHNVHIGAVENGYLISISTFGATVSLVAKDQAEMLALLATVEIKPPAYGLDEPYGAGTLGGMPNQVPYR